MNNIEDIIFEKCLDNKLDINHYYKILEAVEEEQKMIKKPANRDMIALYKKTMKEYNEHLAYTKIALKNANKEKATKELKYAKQNVDDIIKLVNTMDISTLSVVLSTIKKELTLAFKALALAVMVSFVYEFTIKQKVRQIDEKIFRKDLDHKGKVFSNAFNDSTVSKEYLDKTAEDFKIAEYKYFRGRECRERLADEMLLRVPFLAIAIKEIADITKKVKSDDPIREMNACREKILIQCSKLKKELTKLEDKINKLPDKNIS